MKKVLFTLFLVTFLTGVAFIVNAADKKLAGDDKKFIMEAASGGMMEVQLGQMVQQKAQAQDVKAFAQRMVNDHGKANEELKSLAQTQGVSLPSKLEPKHKKTVDLLSKTPGSDLDKVYMREMVKDHAEDVAKFRMASQKVQDADLKGWASKTLPTLEQHLQQAREVAQKHGVDVGAAEKEGAAAAAKKK